MIRIGSNRIGRALVKDINVNGIYLGPKLVWGREVELLQMFKASVIADGGIFDEELFTTEFFRVHQTIRNEAIVLIVCGAYKAGVIYGINCITGQAVPFTFGRLGIGTYVDRNGIWRSAGSNLPRIDYEPETLNLRGYLFENSGVDLNNYSTPSSLGQMSSKGGVSIISSLEPDFANEVVFNQPDFPSTTRYWYINNAGASMLVGNTYTLTAIIKANFTPVLTALSGSRPDSITVRIGGSTVPGQYTYSVKKLRNNIWIVTATRTVVGGDNLSFTGILGTISSTGQVFSVLYAGIEDGAYSTSLIPTNGSQGTRAADSLISQSDLIRDAGSTLYFEGQRKSSGANRLFARSNNTSGTFAYCTSNNNDWYIYDGVNFRLTSIPNSNDTVSKIAGSFGSNGLTIVGNGGASAYSPYKGIFSNGVSLFPHRLFGSYASEGKVQNHIRAFAIIHRELSQGEQIALTT